MIKPHIAIALVSLALMLAACSSVERQGPALRSGPEVGSAANYATALPAARFLPRAMPVT